MRLPFVRRPPGGAVREQATARSTTSSPVPATSELIVHGGSWCIDCHVATWILDARHIPFRWVDPGRDLAAQERLSAAGYRPTPVVFLPDGRTLVEPSPREFAQALGPCHA